ncbi:arsenate reductase (azurin) large subunit [Sedimenticola hydrogenitrophicus]|uniref:arsenate reductase (azurin) large subunit n=1 Tax=Sedimenticola hydrogenitrophicus TaxID=2967975 RepID=UPI0021A61817|nr:arsenate reductase (azurin) large subunit [Sedimenticola hydrogenitrophicus]
MSTKYYLPEDKAPLPPVNAEVLTTCCDYCIVACGYKVYRWPVGAPDGGPQAHENAFKVSFPTGPMQAWVAPTQHNVVMHDGRPHNVVIIPDKEAQAVNLTGDSSIRGGCIAQKVYNPNKPTRDRLMSPMIRINGTLQPVSWDMALDVATEVMKHVVEKHGANAYGMKTYLYQYIENTYAISKFALRHMNTANFAFHDTPSDVTSTPGFRDAGFENFAPSYQDWAAAETLLIAGTDPYETKTILFNQFIKPAIDAGQKTVWLNVRETAGIAYAKSRGNALFLQIDPGTDTPVLGAILRVILENGWEDKEWIEKWVNNQWASDSGFGQGTRNTPWQWRTTWGQFQTKGFEDYKQWNLAQKEYDPKEAAKIANIDPADIYKAAEWLAKPKADGRRVKASFAIEKGFYWSNNTGNTNAVATLATVCGAGGRPGQMVGRLGGHQRGYQSGGAYPRNKSPQKHAGRRRQSMDCDRYFYAGHTRFAHVIGTTWIQAMCGSAGLNAKFEEQVTNNPHQVRSFDKQEIIDTLKARADSGGTVVLNQEIYLRDPIGSRFADIVLPAATWGESDFIRANGERRLRLYSKFYDAPGDAKPDWWIMAELGKRMGFDGFDWKDANQVCEESSRFSRTGPKAYHMIKVAAHAEGKTLHEKLRELGTSGIQGPTFYNYKTGELLGSKRLHDTTLTPEQMEAEGRSMATNMVNKKGTHFNTQSGKVNIQKHPWSLFSDYWEWMKPKDDELWHTNGRVNEIWQSGFDDVDRRAYIAQRWPENWTEIHPDDAAARGIESGDQLMLFSERVPNLRQSIKAQDDADFSFASRLKNGWIELNKAAVTAVAIVTPHVKKGTLYSYYLNTNQPSNALQGRVPDQISGNYNYKMGVAKVKKIGESKYKSEFRSMSFAPRNIV